MTTFGLTLSLAPFASWATLAALGGAAALLTGFAALRRAPGAAWRALGAAALWLILANPSLVSQERRPRANIGVVVVDDSASQSIGERRRQTEQALAALVERAKALPNLELRVIRVGGDAGAAAADDGTALFGALDRALSDVPRKRFAGAVMITDGEVHDAPGAGAPAPPGPLHALITGRRDEVDRRLVVVRAPSFGLVDKPVQITVKVEDAGVADGAPLPVTMRRDGGEETTEMAPANREATLDLTLTHGGETVVELATPAGPHELTLINNRAVVSIHGVRDRLRVLLITGEPTAGERTWRTLLKSDPSVDLVHFTILRSPEKQDGTPINELSLIAFPIRELFEVKLPEFDLIIFDRYRRRNILPPIYLQAIADYVRHGGAVLEAAGPTDATNLSLFNSALGQVLPAQPTGRVIEAPFKPKLTELGRRHPVSQGLVGGGAAGAEPSWGSWFRHIEMTSQHGQVLMSGAEDGPLLILDRAGDGRIAQLASDQIWLWSRGYQGGGPSAELIRRLAHWLMREPELDEDTLAASLSGTQITVTRRSLEPGGVEIGVTDPLGQASRLKLTDQDDGRATGALTVTQPGLYRFEDGRHTALAAVGAINPREFADVRATDAVLGPAVKASGGASRWLADAGVPELRMIEAGDTTAGRTWLGLVDRKDYDVVGRRQTSLLPAALALLIGAGLVLAAWWREGR